MEIKIYTPAVTVLNGDDRIDVEQNLLVAEHLIAGGVDGIVPLGSTGEFPYLGYDDKKKYLTELFHFAARRTTLLPGVGGGSRTETVALGRHALALGAKGVLIGCEFYFHLSQDDFFSYYGTLADEIRGPIYLYNYPARTGNEIAPETVARLVRSYPNIVGMKDSVPDFSHTAAVLAAVLPVRPAFEMLSGFDDQLPQNAAAGGAGGVGALSNVVPTLYRAWVTAFREGNAAAIDEGARRIAALMPLYTLESNPQKLLKELLRRYCALPVSTRCVFPFDTLRPSSLEQALALLAENDRPL